MTAAHLPLQIASCEGGYCLKLAPRMYVSRLSVNPPYAITMTNDVGMAKVWERGEHAARALRIMARVAERLAA